MSTKVTYPHIAKRRGKPAHLKRVPRVRVAQIVMDYLAYGWSVDEMCRQYPYLSPAEAHAAMAYYYDHQEEIEEEIRSEEELVQQARAKALPTAFEIRMRAKGLL